MSEQERKRRKLDNALSIQHPPKRRKLRHHRSDIEMVNNQDTVEAAENLKKLKVIDLKEKMKSLNLKVQSQWRKNDLIHQITIYYANKALNEDIHENNDSETSENEGHENTPNTNKQNKAKKRVTFNLTPTILGPNMDQLCAELQRLKQENKTQITRINDLENELEIKNAKIEELESRIRSENDQEIKEMENYDSVTTKKYKKGKTVCISSGDEGVIEGRIVQIEIDRVLIKWEQNCTNKTKQRWYKKMDKSIWLKR